MDKNPLEQAIEAVLNYKERIANPNYRLEEKDYTTLSGAIRTISDQYATNTPREEWDKHPLYKYILAIRDIMFEDRERIRQDMLERHKNYMKRAEAGGKFTQEEVEDMKDITSYFR